MPFCLDSAVPFCSTLPFWLQAFNWESNQQNWWQNLLAQAQRFADLGFTVVWLPPPTTSVAPQGYMPLDYYNLNSAYGSEEDLRKCVPPPPHPLNIGLFPNTKLETYQYPLPLKTMASGRTGMIEGHPHL